VTNEDNIARHFVSQALDVVNFDLIFSWIFKVINKVCDKKKMLMYSEIFKHTFAFEILQSVCKEWRMNESSFAKSSFLLLTHFFHI